MQIPHEIILDILTKKETLAAEEWKGFVFTQVMPLLMREEDASLDPEKIWPIIKDWMERLPEPEKMRKITNGFTRKAEENRHLLRNLSWWDIDQTMRHLLGDVVKTDGNIVRVLFMWKKRRGTAGDRILMPTTYGHASWEWDPVLKTMRFAIEGETFDHVMDAFDRWLIRSPSDVPTPLHAA